MKNIQINSKLIKSGDIFVAISCEHVNEHIVEAFRRGAQLVFAEKTPSANSKNSNIVAVQDTRLLASRLARVNYPMQPAVCVAVTGTNGKSSVSHFLSQIWTNSFGGSALPQKPASQKSANLGTLGLFIDQKKTNPENILIPNLTTPDPITFHRIMEYLAKQNVEHCVFEASSHALEQKRCHSISLTAAAFTNFASDHLDYHKTRKAYLLSKLRLFKEILPSNMPAIVSQDFPYVCEEVAKINQNLITFGMAVNNFVRAHNIREFPDRIIFDLSCGSELFSEIEVKLFGKFQIMNVLCAISLAMASGMDIASIVETLHQIKPLNGRMEHIKSVNGGDVYVDFAHTAEGFRSALSCFKKTCPGRLICVFGCGGDRDKSKRSEMGKAASEVADICIITDDNPRTEPPADIRRQIIEACPGAKEIGSRREAIKYAISLINPGDFVVILGKGHETQQIYAEEVIYFNDKDEILSQFSE